MSKANVNQILVSSSIQNEIDEKYECEFLGEMELKGKSAPMMLYELTGQRRNVGLTRYK
jgi:class 3 adenylate cyclase